eukprot:gb/GEZN01009745.1/.p1 GENE.gb/GEZN01009745.1/~~gb/GEZN01009745.1/.p1  ORF type:complete len:287 (+),score=55.42 gb/GEZN01009745.1/:132-992(+)
MEQGVLKNEVDLIRQNEVANLLLSENSPSDHGEKLAEFENALQTARFGQRKRPLIRRKSSSACESERSKSRRTEQRRDSKDQRRDSNSLHELPFKNKEPRDSDATKTALTFNKEEVLVVPETKKPLHSPLSMALAARMAEAETEVGEELIPATKVKVRVYLPVSASDDDGDELDTFVDFFPEKTLTGLGLVKECLHLYDRRRQAEGPELNQSADKYELRIAEEDGEVDEDLPALSLAQTIEEVGQNCFAILLKEDNRALHTRGDSDVTVSDLREFEVKPAGCCCIL